MRKLTITATAVAMAAVTVCSTGCNTMSKNFASDYVSAVLDVTYHGNTEKYLSFVDSTEEEAQEIFDTMASYYAETLAYYCDVNTEFISEETNAAYTDFAKEILDKAKYSITNSETGEKLCYVTISIEPINLLEQMEAPLDTCIDAYTAQFDEMTEEEYNALTDEEWSSYEESYAEMVLTELKTCGENLEYAEPTEFVMQIQMEANGKEYLYSPVNDSDWDTIDELILNLS